MFNTSSYRPALTRLAADRRGVTAIVTAIALTALLGFAGLAIDVAYWLNATRGLQAAADQSAYSAAAAAGSTGCTSTTAVPQAIAIAAARGYGASGTPTTRDNTTTVADAKTTLTVTCTPSNSHFTVKIEQLQPMWFASLFMSTAPTAAASATAQLAGKASDLCILAIDGTNPTEGYTGSDADSLYVTGSSNINVGCGIAVNSSNASSLGAGSNASGLTATDIYLVGGDQPSGNGFTPSIAATGCSTCNPVIPPDTILKNQLPVTDPYANRVVPAHSCASASSQSFKNTTINPGTFCGGLSLDGNITVNCGTYVVAGGALSMTSGANVVQNSSCSTGVTFILTNSKPGASDYASLSYNGNPSSSLVLTAPTSGPYGGLVFFQDRDAPNPQSGTNNNNTCGSGAAQNKLGGTGHQALTGAAYFPAQTICFGGGSSSDAANKCTQIIAYNINFNGNSAIKSICAGVGIASMSILTPQLIR